MGSLMTKRREVVFESEIALANRPTVAEQQGCHT